MRLNLAVTTVKNYLDFSIRFGTSSGEFNLMTKIDFLDLFTYNSIIYNVESK